MTDNRLSRTCYFKGNQVPTISVIKKYMKPALADVYFKSMDQKLKVIAGLAPPLKGGGGCWYIPPKDLLQGRAVLKPLNTEHLKRLGWCGIDEIAMKKMIAYRDRMMSETEQALRDKDEQWENTVTSECKVHYRICTENESKAVTEYLTNAFSTFVILYRTSLTKLEKVLANAAIKKIEETRSKAHHDMLIKYEDLLQKQAAKITNKYNTKLLEEKEKLKVNFIQDLEKSRATFYDKLHDINLEKYVAVEKLRHLLECQKRACQVYVAMKERQECLKQINSVKHKHSKKKKTLIKKMQTKVLHIRHAEQKEIKQAEFIRIWQKKVCHVVKNFQMFILYCLKMMPEQADFFINMEKLMLIQLNESLEYPSVENIFELDFPSFHAPIPNPHPFYLFCEKNNKPHVRKELCSKRCTSSASQFPVIVINKHCIYANCDNFKKFADKVQDVVDGNILSDASSEDYNCDLAVPVKYSSSRQLQELKLESSIMQVLEQEIANKQNVEFACPVCNIPYCSECDRSVPHSPTSVQPKIKTESLASLETLPSVYLTQQEELAYTRDSKWESYMKFVQSKKCNCSKLAKKHLLEQLPAYMRKMSTYDAPELLSYKPCSALELKTLVQLAKGKKYSRPKLTEPKTKEVACQYTDFEYNHLCRCFSNQDFENILPGSPVCNMQASCTIQSGSYPLPFISDSPSPSCSIKSSKSFVEARILSLRRLVESSEIRDIFKRTDCNFHK
ncbi:unnamed protein product [Arctia plantaginis]|uniref:Uncharacterized protein n=1 Tax=Arctia plantaginis TaxID=874455 RepID=A0A8S1AZM8_ARCPL|nr:unnamed protein product [Arctia plantaginis]